MAEPRTLNDVFFEIVGRRQAQLMLVRKAGQWIPIGPQDFYRNVAGMARALANWGISKGDRVAILSENRPEWPIADFACLLLGAVVVPIYTTLTAQQSAYIVCDSGARAAFVSSEDQLRKILSIKGQTGIAKVVVMDSVDGLEGVSMQRLMRSGPSGRDPELERTAKQITADDLACIIYTSGTTGTSKGVQLTHGNLTSNVSHSLRGFKVGLGHTSVSFLPLSHVTARHVDIALLRSGVTLAYCPSFEGLPQVLRDVRPTIFVGVPRVYEKIYLQVERNAQGKVKKRIYRWARAVGEKHRSMILAGQVPKSLDWRLANRLVYSKVQEQLGGRVEVFISGGAPLGRELAEWYASIGIRIHEGYGLTETSPVIAVNNPSAHRLGTVGRPLDNVEVRIGEDSEILVRGPSVFRAYWNRPDDTRNAFADGWFKTGDIGTIDGDGFLTVTDRKKDLLKTSGGKFIAPQPVENCLKLHALIGAAVVLGDRRKFASVLIAPHFPLLEEWAQQQNIAFATRAALVSHPKVKQLYEDIVAEVNRGLARYETLKKVLLVPDEFSASDGSMTPTLKLRRKVIEERYRQQIDLLYEESVDYQRWTAS